MIRAIPIEQDLFEFATGGKVEATEKKYAELLEMMMLDKNYSVAKEKLTCYLAGVNHNPAKHDYDGKALIDGKHRPIEVKPTTYWGGQGARLSMKCSFGDFTDKRFKRYREDDVSMVVSGFNKKTLVYGVQFDFNEEPFLNDIQEQMDKVKRTGKVGTRLIPAPNIKVISQIENVSILYPSRERRDILEKNRSSLNKHVYEFLMDRLR